MSREGEARHPHYPGEDLCPVCKQPVPKVVVGRRKVLGAFVPVWGPGDCFNPDCPLNVPPQPGQAPRPPARDGPR